MTPDKTLEEIERILADFHKHVIERAYDDANPNHIVPDTTRLNPILLLAKTQQQALVKLRVQLRTYGAHAPICRGADNCDCGFAEVQKELNG